MQRRKFPECRGRLPSLSRRTQFHGMLIEHDTETLKQIQINSLLSPSLAFLKLECRSNDDDRTSQRRARTTQKKTAAKYLHIYFLRAIPSARQV